MNPWWNPDTVQTKVARTQSASCGHFLAERPGGMHAMPATSPVDLMGGVRPASR